MSVDTEFPSPADVAVTSAIEGLARVAHDLRIGAGELDARAAAAEHNAAAAIARAVAIGGGPPLGLPDPNPLARDLRGKSEELHDYANTVEHIVRQLRRRR